MLAEKRDAIGRGLTPADRAGHWSPAGVCHLLQLLLGAGQGHILPRACGLVVTCCHTYLGTAAAFITTLGSVCSLPSSAPSYGDMLLLKNK